MAKKGIIVLVSCVVIVAVAWAYVKIYHTDKSQTDVAQTKQENVLEKKDIIKDKHKIYPKELHKDILRQISSLKQEICGVSKEDADKELNRRADLDLDIDKHDADVKTLPFEILKIIAKSPASIAGISPKKAINELVSRYLAIDLTDSEDVDSASLLKALHEYGEQKAIDDWAKNEDGEAVEAFLKEEADRDPSSVANFAVGLKKLNSDHEEGLKYMNRFASHPTSDAYDNPDQEKAYKELIEAVKNLK